MTRGIGRRARIAAAIAAVALLAAAYYFAYGGHPAYVNPVLDNDAPDPAVIRAEDAYYAYTTQAYFGARFVNVPILRSTDMIAWELVGDAFVENPAWAAPSPGDMWAPHMAAWSDGSYRLYFSAARADGSGMAIGVATADHPEGPFRDSGGPIVTDEGFAAIDPFVLALDDGTRYLYWGSDSEPIRARRLTEDGLTVEGDVSDVLFPSIGSYESLIEGAWVTERAGRYYLFYSGDACCGERAHYAVMVARSDSPLGPYERAPHNPILADNEAWHDPGHNATIRDAAGRDWIVYHAMPRGENTFRLLLIDRIDWVDGWPQINGGNGPTSCGPAAPHDPLPRINFCG